MFILNEQYSAKEKMIPLNEDIMFAKHPNLIRCEKILQDIIDEDQEIIPDRALQGKRTKEVQNILKDHFQFNFFTLSIGEYMDPIMYGLFNVSSDVVSFINKSSLSDKMIQTQRTQFRSSFINTITSPTAVNTGASALPNAFRRFFSNSNDFIVNDGTRIKFNKSTFIADGMVSVLPQFYRSTAKNTPTGGSLLGVILHEIGHSFYLGTRISRTIGLMYGVSTVIQYGCTKISIWIYQAITAIFGMNSTASFVYGKIIGFLDQLLSVTFMFEGLFSSDKSVRNTAILNLARSGFSRAFITLVETYISKDLARMLEMAGVKVANLLDIINPIVNSVNLLLKIIASPVMVVSESVSTLLKMDGKECETFCDMFATVHGYGTELHSFFLFPEIKKNMESMQTSSDGIASFMQKIGITEAVFGIPQVLSTYPETSNRAFVTLENLKKLKNQASSKAQRDVIDRQIESIIKMHSMVKKADKYKVTAAFQNGNFDEAYQLVYGRLWKDQVIYMRSLNEGVNNIIKQIDDGINKITDSTTYRTMAELDKTVKKS